MNMTLLKQLTLLFYLVTLVSVFAHAMDFDERMIPIKSFKEFCSFYEDASRSIGRAIVAYRVSRFSRFYSKGSPTLDDDDKKIIVSKKSFFSRVHYALIQRTRECGVSIEEILSPCTWYEFWPILAKDPKKEVPKDPMHIVSLQDAQRSYGHNFVFDENAYNDEEKFQSPSELDAPRELINFLRAQDDLRMRAVNADDARLLLKYLETQKVSLGWQDRGLSYDLKQVFEKENGFSYESREEIKQKNL